MVRIVCRHRSRRPLADLADGFGSIEIFAAPPPLRLLPHAPARTVCAAVFLPLLIAAAKVPGGKATGVTPAPPGGTLRSLYAATILVACGNISLELGHER
jgi:hypothetical protein